MKIRKSLKNTSIIIAIVLFIISCIGIGNTLMNKSTISNSKEIYSYTNKYNYDYSINLKENKYIDKDELTMDQPVYVTKLIEDMDLNFNYTYEGNKETEIKYKYKILGQLNAVYTKDGIEQKVWQKEYTLMDEKTDSKTTNKIDINENIKLDLKNLNKLVNDFETEMGMSLDSKYIVTLVIETDTDLNSTDIPNEFKSSIEIDLGKKTTVVSGENNIDNNKNVTSQYKENGKINVPVLIIYIVILLLSIVLFVKVFNKETINVIKNKYRQDLNRILKICQDKIVQVSSNPVVGKENVIDVKEFGEIIKVSEELFKPILYWYCQEDEEAHFYVVSNDMTYRFILKK